jgi:hypothetical protein
MEKISGKERLEKIWEQDIKPEAFQEFACRCAQQAWGFAAGYGEIDHGSVEAAALKIRWLKGEATDEELTIASEKASTACDATEKAAKEAHRFAHGLVMRRYEYEYKTSGEHRDGPSEWTEESKAHYAENTLAIAKSYAADAAHEAALSSWYATTNNLKASEEATASVAKTGRLWENVWLAAEDARKAARYAAHAAYLVGKATAWTTVWESLDDRIQDLAEEAVWEMQADVFEQIL